MKFPRILAAAAIFGLALISWAVRIHTAEVPSAVTTSDKPTPLLDVQVAGHGEPQIIFLPGLACPGSVWDHVVARFEGNYRCHVVTLAGFGGLPPVKCAHFLDDMADAIIAYARTAKIERPVIIGHSMGGVLAMKIALRAPDLPARLVIVDSLPFLPKLIAPRIDNAEAARPLAEAHCKLLGPTPAEFAARQRELMAGMVTSPDTAALFAAETSKSDPATCAQALYDFLTTDLRPSLGQIKCPTLVLAALGDKVSTSVPRAAVVEAMHAQYANLAGVRILFFDKSRHFIMADDLDGFTDALGKELQRKD